MESFRSVMSSLRYGVARRCGKFAVAAFLGLSAIPAQAADVTIAALGDSLTQGYGLIDQEGFVPQLTNWLRARGQDVLVINAGVSGDTTAGGLARVDWTLDPRVDAMIVALGGNDMLRGIDPAVSRANLDGILQAARAKDVRVLLVGLNAPGNYGPDYKAEFEAIFPSLAAEYDTLLYPDFFAGLTGDETTREALADLMQPDGIHPNAQGVARIVEDIGPYVLRLIEATR